MLKSFFIFKGYIKVSEFTQLYSTVQYVVCPSQWFLKGYLVETPLCIIMMRGVFLAKTWENNRRVIQEVLSCTVALGNNTSSI